MCPLPGGALCRILAGDVGQRLVEVLEDVSDGLEADAEAHHLRRDAARLLLLGVHLRVRGGGRVDGERARVAHVGHVAHQLQRVDERPARGGAVRRLDAEDHHGPALALEVLEVLLVLGVVLQAGVLDPRHLGVRLEVRGHLEGVLAVALHAQGQRLDALEELPGVVGRDAPAEVAQRHRQHAQFVRQRRQGFGQVVAPAQAPVRRVRLVEQRVLAGAPLEAALVDHDAADAGAVAAHPLRQGADDDVRAVLEGLAQVRRGEGAVHDERDAEVVRHRGDGLQVADLQRRVGHRLAEHRAGLVVDGRPEVLGVLGVHERDGDAEGGEDVVELRVGAAVQLVAADDVVARLRQRDDGVEARGGAGGHGEAGERVAALQLGHAALQHVRGRVHQARVDVAKLLEGEQVGGVLGVLELEGSRAVQRDGAGRALAEAVDALIADGVPARVQAQGVESLRHFDELKRNGQ
mmetsp:Transcript_7243/g.18419  ORF Transcript_7243/g.18419 Transcript_7243/m.18419 type:complete len:464 (-) Transcript_7243:43-1434(-)